jgi:hypothetical protein
LAVAVCFGGCSIHPLPKDVTGYKTAKIVRKIRCEAREAVIGAAIDYLNEKGHHEVVDEPTLMAMDRRSVSPKDLRKLEYLERTGIVYSFALDGNETDTFMFNADIIKPITHGTVTFNPSAGNIVKRDNLRAFTVSDSFSTLLNLHPKHCLELGSSDPNFEYPVVGRIGVDEMIKTFVEMTVTGEIIAQEDPSKSISLSPAGLPAMVDTLTFTTTVSGGLNPKIALSPVGTSLQLMDTSITASAMRVDQHEVIIGLGLAKPTNTTVALANPKTTSLFITTAPRSADTGEAIAAQAVAQQILRFEIGKPVIPVATQ